MKEHLVRLRRTNAAGDEAYKTFLLEYPFGGERWMLEIKATSADEARARMKALPWAEYKGEVALRIAAELPRWFQTAALAVAATAFAAYGWWFTTHTSAAGYSSPAVGLICGMVIVATALAVYFWWRLFRAIVA